MADLGTFYSLIAGLINLIVLFIMAITEMEGTQYVHTSCIHQIIIYWKMK